MRFKKDSFGIWRGVVGSYTATVMETTTGWTLRVFTAAGVEDTREIRRTAREAKARATELYG